MISAALIAATPISEFHDNTKTPFRLSDWLSGGTWAVRGGPDVMALGKWDNEAKRDALAIYEAALPGVPAVEDIALRLPSVPGIEDITETCKTCRGDGGHGCDCDQCDVVCETCDGDGIRVVEKGRKLDPGQRVFRSGDVTTILDARLAPLLDGLRVVRLGTEKLDPLGGIDADGRLVVLVMPMRADVRKSDGGR